MYRLILMILIFGSCSSKIYINDCCEIKYNRIFKYGERLSNYDSILKNSKWRIKYVFNEKKIIIGDFYNYDSTNEVLFNDSFFSINHNNIIDTAFLINYNHGYEGYEFALFDTVSNFFSHHRCLSISGVNYGHYLLTAKNNCCLIMLENDPNRLKYSIILEKIGVR